MQLISITTNPLRYELVSRPARLEINRENPSSDVTVKRGEVQIRQRQVQVQLDTFARRSSMGLKGTPDLMNDAAQRGRRAALEATGEYVDFGAQLIHVEKGANIPDAMFSRMMQRAQSSLVFMPLSPTEISWIPGEAQMEYTPTQMDFRWNVGQTRLNFVPGGFDMNITQYPSIKIEYLGGPVYVPPSAAPDFEGYA